MKVFPIQSDDPRVERAVGILEGMTQSNCNVVIFNDTPELWFQFYLGLYLEKTTFILIKKRDTSDERLSYFRFRGAHVTVADDFDTKAMEDFARKIELWVKREK